MANPWCKPLHSLEMKHFSLESTLMVMAHLFKANHGILDPIIDVFLFDVHVNMEGSTRRLQREQRGLPGGFA